ncbi:MAG: fibronectin type III domain-containing protein, partial [Leptothrix sp. (in: b-proteobacteria)]
ATGAAGASAQVTSAAVTVSAAPAATLTAPTTLTAAITNATTVALRWIDASTNENNFTVESSIDGGLTWLASGTVTRTAAQRTRTGTAVTFNATVAMGNTYQFRVRANTTAGAFSNYATVGPVVMAVGTPTGVTAVAGAAVGAATISWTDVALDAGYRVERSADAGVTWTTAATALTNATSASVTGLTVGATYQFRVVAVNGTSTATSAAVSYTVPAAAITVTAPTGLTASITNATTVALRWTDASTNEANFTAESSTDGGVTWTAAGSVTRTAAQTTATGGAVTLNAPVVLGNTYQFRVRGNAATGGISNYATSGAVVVDVTAPTGVAVAAGAAAGAATISWTDVALDAGYRIEQSANGGTTWTTAATALTNATSASVTGLTVGATYQFRVVSINGVRTATSTAVSYLVPAAPTAGALTAPTNFAVTVTTVAGALQANASWTDNSTAETSFQLQGCDGTCTAASTWSTFATVTRTGTATTGTGTTVTAVDRGLNPAMTYSYRVVPRSNTATGTPSAIVTIQTP